MAITCRFWIRSLERHTTAGSIRIANTTGSMGMLKRTHSMQSYITVTEPKKSLTMVSIRSWIPKIKDFQNDHSAQPAGIWDIIEDAPLFQLISLVGQQLVGFQGYLLFNLTGRTSYPRWTNHFNRKSRLGSQIFNNKCSCVTYIAYSAHFRRSERFDIVLSDLGLLATISFLVYASHRLDAWTVIRLYGVPWVMINQNISLIVALSHLDNKLPRYRDKAYTHTRGALVTVDRNLLGWQGKFFLHYVSMPSQ